MAMISSNQVSPHHKDMLEDPAPADSGPGARREPAALCWGSGAAAASDDEHGIIPEDRSPAPQGAPLPRCRASGANRGLATRGRPTVRLTTMQRYAQHG